MEQNVARSRTCGEVLWCEVRFFSRVFSRVFLRHPFLHISEVSLVFSTLSVLFSYLPSSSLLPSPILFSPLSFPSLLFLYSPPSLRKYKYKHNHKHHHTPNTEPPTYKIPLRPPPLHSPPIYPSTQQNPILPPYTSNDNKIYHSSRVPYIPTFKSMYTYLETLKSIHQQPKCSLSPSPRKV